MATPSPTATMPSPEPVHATAVTLNVSVIAHLRSQLNEPASSNLQTLSRITTTKLTMRTGRESRTNGPGEDEGAGWKTETELAAAAASSPSPRPHQAAAETGARRSMTWRKNGELSSVVPLLPRGGDGR